jgi:hypothetical protein
MKSMQQTANKIRISKYLIIIIIPLTLFSCGVSKKNNQVSFDEHTLIMSERDINISAIIEYVKNEYKECRDTCHIEISGKLSFIDTCYKVFYKREFKKSQWSKDKQIIFGPTNLNLDEFGEIIFTNPYAKMDTLFDYKFSPFIYSQKKQKIYGQVLKANGSKYTLVYNVIANKIYYSFELPYGENCDIFHF